MTQKKKATKKSATSADTKSLFTRFSPETEEWLRRHAEVEGYTTVQELLRQIVREYRARVEGKEKIT
jgi:hypothetical protein